MRRDRRRAAVVLRRRVPAISAAFVLTAAGCAGAARQTPVPVPAPSAATGAPTLQQLVSWHGALPVTAIRVSGRLSVRGGRSGTWRVRILATRAGGLRVVAAGADGFELASDGARVQGRDGGGAVQSAEVGRLPAPGLGRWAALDPRLLVDALLPAPLPSAERLADAAVIEREGTEARLARLRRVQDGAYRPVRRLSFDLRRRRLVRIERFDRDGRRVATIQLEGTARAPWPFPAVVRIASERFGAVLEIGRAEAAGRLLPADFHLASASSQRP